jgi:hypothetical protein
VPGVLPFANAHASITIIAQISLPGLRETPPLAGMLERVSLQSREIAWIACLAVSRHSPALLGKSSNDFETR